jgi:hypothetical protein
LASAARRAALCSGLRYRGDLALRCCAIDTNRGDVASVEQLLDT